MYTWTYISGPQIEWNGIPELWTHTGNEVVSLEAPLCPP